LRGSEEGRLGRVLVSSPFLGAVLAALTWPIASIVPGVGPDPSWVAGLYMAHGEGLQFGRDIVFTYGPLGFLEVPALYEQGMWVLAFLYQALVQVVLATSLLWVARRALPLALAVTACYLLLVVGQLEGAVVLIAFVWCFVALGERSPRFAPLLVTIGGGVLGAVELLGKANYGMAILSFAFLTVLGLPGRRRNLPVLAVGAISAFAVCWLAAGQDLAGVPDFLTRSAQVVSGYSSAMGTDIVAAEWKRIAAFCAMVLFLAGAATASLRDAPPRRLASLAVAALFAFVTFKQGFVRQGLGNTPEFFVLIAGAGLAVASRLPRLPLRAAALGLAAPLAALALAALPTPSLWDSLRPQAHVEYLRDGLDALLVPGERSHLMAEARSAMRATYRLDPGIAEALDGRTVHIDPWEAGVAWAYDLDWQPLPVMQSYVAYTPQLDELNARALSGPDGPAAILRHAGLEAGGESVDDRYPGWESPAAMRAMLCRYRPVRSGARWQLLVRGVDRCGSPMPIGAVHSTTGRRIAIPPPPAPDELVFARVDGVGVSGWESLRAAVYRAPERTATLGERGAWRLVPDTAGDGLILSVPRRVDYPAPFELAPDVSTMSLQIADAPPRPVTVEFFVQRIRPFAGAGRGRGAKPLSRSIARLSRPIAEP
jgi:hypothetical protein